MGYELAQVFSAYGGPVFEIHRIISNGGPRVRDYSGCNKDGWIYKHGPPSCVLSDQEPSVDSTEVRKALAVYGISKKNSSPYHPEGDGQSERGIQVVKQVLRCVLEERKIAKNSWPSLLPEVSYILNATSNTSTCFTPYRVMYVVDPRPVPTATLSIRTQNQDYNPLEWTKEIQSSSEIVNKEVTVNLGQSRGRMKNTYDKGKDNSDVRPGNLVLLDNRVRKSGLDRRFEGPLPC